MLIYHITDNQLVCTQVTLGVTDQISHFDKELDDIPISHLTSVRELRSGGKVYITGGTYASAVYKGKFEDRQDFKHYLET